MVAPRSQWRIREDKTLKSSTCMRREDMLVGQDRLDSLQCRWSWREHSGRRNYESSYRILLWSWTRKHAQQKFWAQAHDLTKALNPLVSTLPSTNALRPCHVGTRYRSSPATAPTWLVGSADPLLTHPPARAGSALFPCLPLPTLGLEQAAGNFLSADGSDRYQEPTRFARMI
ncbi:hypothetical protein EJB05_35140, partial [Eragrostis curvula]